MPKLVLTPVDHSPPPPKHVQAAKILGMVLSLGALIGITFLLARYSTSGPQFEEWTWDAKQVRFNFEPIYTPAQLDRMHREAAERAFEQFGLPTNSPTVEAPRESPKANDGLPVPFEEKDKPGPIPEEMRGVDQREMWAERDARHLKLADQQLKKGRAFDLVEETRGILDFVDFTDADRTRCMAEYAAYQGRQAPPNERLAFNLLLKLPTTDLAQKVERDVFYHGPGQKLIDEYRCRAFAAEGRLFDLYQVKLEQPVISPDGGKVEAYYEGVVAFLNKGAPGEHAIEHRVVLFQCLALPEELKGFVDDDGSLAQTDKLATEAVMVKLTGTFLRLWIYNREVSPFSTKAKPVLCQAHLPLLLTADVARSDAKPLELTDEMLQQVRDAMREDPIFLEGEAAYYAMLARAADPADTVEAVPNIGYFDLAGGGGETGPRYRGQGIRIVGMIGDNYAPVILPPNIAGMRRVFRTLLLGDTGNFETPERYLLDMIEPPTGLGPRSLVAFNARYYRNVFEAKSTSSQVRPLLIVRRAASIRESKSESDDWIFALAVLGGFILVGSLVAWFAFSDRRERRAFEASSMEASRKRIEKGGSLKLKPLPSAEPKDKEVGKPPPSPPTA